MPIINIFSKRQKRLRGEVPDVYECEIIPEELRVQVIHILRDAFGEPYRNRYGDLVYPPGTIKEAYEFIHATLYREYGLFTLSKDDDSDCYAVYNFFLETQETEKAVDVIEVSFQYIDQYASNISPDAAIAELNHRFQEHDIGYQYQSGQVIRVDSQLAHSEVVKPALSLLSDPMYKGANDEFLSALKHYRKGRYKECLNECLKAFESCIKVICETRRWAYNDRDSISHLIGIICKHKLIPDSMQSHFSGLRSTLEAGVPTLRNKLSGHGQGSKEVTVPEYIAAYVLHLTASNILLLARANDELT